MTYKLGLAQGFEVDPDGSLSDPANLISAWPLTELAGPRRDRAGCLDMRTSSDTRFLDTGTPNTAVSTGVKHASDKFVAQFEGDATGSVWPTPSTTNSDRMLACPLGDDFGSRTAMSFSIWVYVDSTMGASNKQGAIATHYNYDMLDGWMIGQQEQSGNNKFVFSFVVSNSADNLYSGTSLSTSTWYHVVGTWDGTNRIIYLNGSSDATDTPTIWGACDTTSAFMFGRMPGGGSSFDFPWHGRACHSALWNKCLTAANVTTLYNSGTPNRYKPWITGR